MPHYTESLTMRSRLQCFFKASRCFYVHQQQRAWPNHGIQHSPLWSENYFKLKMSEQPAASEKILLKRKQSPKNTDTMDPFPGSFLVERRLTLSTKKCRFSCHKPSHWETPSRKKAACPCHQHQKAHENPPCSPTEALKVPFIYIYLPLLWAIIQVFHYKELPGACVKINLSISVNLSIVN